MGLRSFLRRWLGIESAQTTTKKTVGRAFVKPLQLNNNTPLREHASKPKTVAGFYDKAGGYHAFCKLEKIGSYDNWLRIRQDRNWQTNNIQFRMHCVLPTSKSGYSKIFKTHREASSFKSALIAHHERMKAKAAKSGLNYN